MSESTARKSGPRWTRRDVIAAAVATGLCPPLVQAADDRRSRRRSGRPPNIVFIMADDLGVFDLSCTGRLGYRTPRIDSIAAQGVMLTKAYANSCTCSPTRTALLSGAYQNRLAVGNYDPLIRDDIGFPARMPTLASLLREQGYVTGLFGKWHLGRPPAFSPLRCGYDEFFGQASGGMDYFTHEVADLGPDRGSPDLFDGEAIAKVQGYSTDLFTDRAIDFLSRHVGRPMLLSLHFNAPHWPWQTREDAGSKRWSGAHFDGGSAAIFASMVEAMDECVGRVLDALEAKGLAEETIVIFTSDNGGERFSQNWPLRGAKGSLYEGGIRVPALVRWPGHIAPGSQSSQLGMSMDWLPTLVGAAGGALPSAAAIDGIDLMPFLTGVRRDEERTVFWRTSSSRAVRKGRWKYLQVGGRDHLFDLEADEMERANQRRRHPDELADLRALFDEWQGQMLPVPADAPVWSPELERALEALEALPSSR